MWKMNEVVYLGEILYLIVVDVESKFVWVLVVRMRIGWVWVRILKSW